MGINFESIKIEIIIYLFLSSIYYLLSYKIIKKKKNISKIANKKIPLNLMELSFLTLGTSFLIKSISLIILIKNLNHFLELSFSKIHLILLFIGIYFLYLTAFKKEQIKVNIAIGAILIITFLTNEINIKTMFLTGGFLLIMGGIKLIQKKINTKHKIHIVYIILGTIMISYALISFSPTTYILGKILLLICIIELFRRTYNIIK